MRRFVVASYNVHRAVGRDGVADIARLTKMIGELAADVVGLQELDCAHATDPLLDHAERLAMSLAMEKVTAPLQEHNSTSIGLAVLSAHPITARRIIDLAVPGREPRAAIDIDIATPSGPLRVVTTHLGLKARERDAQLARLLAHVRPERPTVIMGDFNEWRWRTDAMSQMAEAFGRPVAFRTFPSWRPLAALDLIYVYPAGLLTRAEVVANEAAKDASDHLPVRAILKLDAPPSRVFYT